MRFFTISIFIVVTSAYLISCGTENKPTYSLSTQTIPSEGGTITPSGGEFSEGESVTLASTPEKGWLFLRWEGDWSSTENPTTFVMNSDKLIKGVFEKRTYPLTLQIEGNGTVNERVVQEKSTDYPYGTMVELEAKPEFNWGLKEWSGDISSTENPLVIEIKEEVNITAHFSDIIRTYGGKREDYGVFVNQRDDKGFIIGGDAFSKNEVFNLFGESGDFNSDIFLMKIDKFGKIEWSKTYGGSYIDYSWEITATSDRGFIIAARSLSDDGIFSGRNGKQIALIKVDVSGNIEWLNYYGPTYNTIAEMTSIEQTSDSGYIATINTNSNKDSEFQAVNKSSFGVVTKLTYNGQIEWYRTFGGTNSDYIESVTQTSDNHYIAAGYFYSHDGDFTNMNRGGSDLFIAKLDMNGDILWTKTFGGSSYENVSQIIEKQEGGYTLVGGFESNDGDFSNFSFTAASTFVMDLDSEGNIQWITPLTGSENQWFKKILETDNGYLISGDTRSNDGDFTGINSNSISQGVIAKISKGGQLEWITPIGEDGVSGVEYITQDSESNIIIAGYASSSIGAYEGLNSGANDIVLITLNPDGEIIPFQ